MYEVHFDTIMLYEIRNLIKYNYIHPCKTNEFSMYKYINSLIIMQNRYCMKQTQLPAKHRKLRKLISPRNQIKRLQCSFFFLDNSEFNIVLRK